MSNTIGGNPVGLLSILQSQNFGQNPKELSGTIVPTVEIRELYQLQFQQARAGGVAVPAIGFNQAVVVPATQLWHVKAGGIILGAAAGVSADITMTCRYRGSLFPLTDTIPLAASQTRYVTMKAAPFWAEAGVEFGVDISSLVGAPSIQLSLLISALRA